MRARTSLLVVIGSLLLSACGYTAQVRGVAGPDLDSRLIQGSKICVQKEKADDDSTTTAEVGAKVQQLLSQQGYVITGPEDADFFLVYHYERKSLLNRVRIQPISGTRSGIRTTKVESPFDQTLSLRLIEAASYRESGMEEFLWAGGAVLNSVPTESPRFVDMLLVAGLKHFPEDTLKTLDVKLRLSDPRAKKLRTAGWYPESPVAANED